MRFGSRNAKQYKELQKIITVKLYLKGKKERADVAGKN